MDKFTPAEAAEITAMAKAEGASWSPSPGTVDIGADDPQDGGAPSEASAAPAEPAPAATAPAPEARAPIERDSGELSHRELQLVAERARMQERLELLTMAQQRAALAPAGQARQAEPPPSAPDPDIDPIGYTRHVERTMRAELDRLQSDVQAREQREQQIAQAQQQHAALVDLAHWGQAQEAEFAKQRPDYFQATQAYRQHRESALKVLGFDDAAIPNILAQESMQLAARARQAGQPFGQLVYQLASAAGYRPAAAAAPAQVDPNALQRAVKGYRMDAAPGALAQASSQARALSEMSEDDFKAALAKMSSVERRAIFGE